MLKYIKLLFIAVFLFLACIAQNKPQNPDYLRVDFENPVSSQAITYYMAYQFSSAADTLNPVDSVEHIYTIDNNYHLYFDNLTLNDTIYIRVVSVNQHGRSPYSKVVKGILDETFVPMEYILTDSSLQIRWISRFPGLTTQRWLKLVEAERDSIMSINPDYYIDLGESNDNEIIVDLTNILPNVNYYYFAYEVDVLKGTCISGDLLLFRVDAMPPKVIIIKLLK